MTPDPIHQPVPPSARDFYDYDRDVVRAAVLVGGSNQVIADLLRVLKRRIAFANSASGTIRVRPSLQSRT